MQPWSCVLGFNSRVIRDEDPDLHLATVWAVHMRTDKQPKPSVRGRKGCMEKKLLVIVSCLIAGILSLITVVSEFDSDQCSRLHSTLVV